MTPARRRALLLCVVAVVALGLAAAAMISQHPATQSPAPSRPKLLLLTSLPLMFGEQFSLDSDGSPVLNALRNGYDVVPISITSSDELAKGQLLLMAQPLAQPAEDLVALDQWVRRGGHLLLLADPMLEWPSERPLGDPLRPPAMFMDTGLLAHWGLLLEPPERRGLVMVEGARGPVAYISPGRLATSSSACVLSRAAILAECKIGSGRVVVVADADLLSPSAAELLDPSVDNTAELLAILAGLAR